MSESAAVRREDAAPGVPVRADGRSRGVGMDVLAAVSLGGAVGAMSRYVVTLAFPVAPGGFPWAVFVINVGGCLLIGVLMALVGEGRPAHRLIRPFLGVGVLGGFTTFSAYVLDVQAALAAGRPATAVAYLGGTLVAALVAVAVAARLTRRALGRRDVSGRTRRAAGNRRRGAA
ncbi:CrcB family protein [Thermopolyspora sp. NPDC052614]|uniref:fluoride efflux transporter FluC n=1 Tax=Thermopolyspora sp. NPDC052614 TaxID=3155682 RepID=UPI00343E6945